MTTTGMVETYVGHLLHEVHGAGEVSEFAGPSSLDGVGLPDPPVPLVGTGPAGTGGGSHGVVNVGGYL